VLKDIIASARTGYERDGERGLLKDLYAKQEEYYRAGNYRNCPAKTCNHMGKKQGSIATAGEAYDRHETNVLSSVSQPDLLTLRMSQGTKRW